MNGIGLQGIQSSKKSGIQFGGGIPARNSRAAGADQHLVNSSANVTK